MWLGPSLVETKQGPEEAQALGYLHSSPTPYSSLLPRKAWLTWLKNLNRSKIGCYRLLVSSTHMHTHTHISLKHTQTHTHIKTGNPNQNAPGHSVRAPTLEGSALSCGPCTIAGAWFILNYCFDQTTHSKRSSPDKPESLPLGVSSPASYTDTPGHAFPSRWGSPRQQTPSEHLGGARCRARLWREPCNDTTDTLESTPYALE